MQSIRPDRKMRRRVGRSFLLSGLPLAGTGKVAVFCNFPESSLRSGRNDQLLPDNSKAE